MSRAEPAIKSQPVYSPLAWDESGARHLLAGEGEGCLGILTLLEAGPKPACLVLAGIDPSDELAARLRRVEGASCRFVSGGDALLSGLRRELSGQAMGLRLYLAGEEGFLWKAAREARAFGMSADELRLELCGSRRRPAYCTHCKLVTQGVSTNLYPCPGCGRTLFVRDHFSRELAAYMAYQIDAEVPGQVPPLEKAYP